MQFAKSEAVETQWMHCGIARIIDTLARNPKLDPCAPQMVQVTACAYYYIVEGKPAQTQRTW